jgi:hypothetical protein
MSVCLWTCCSYLYTFGPSNLVPHAQSLTSPCLALQRSIATHGQVHVDSILIDILPHHPVCDLPLSTGGSTHDRASTIKHHDLSRVIYV